MLIIFHKNKFFEMPVTCFNFFFNREEAISDKKLVEKVEMEPLEPKSTDTQTFKMEHCNCERTLKSSKWESEGVNYTDTTCGKDAFRR